MKLLKKIGQIIIYLLVFYFISRIICSNWQKISESLEGVNFIWLLLSLIITTIALAYQSYIWHRLLKYFQPKLTFRESYSTYFKSIITRYLPGGIWVFFARTYLTSKLSFSKTQAFFLILVESLLVVFSGCIVFLLIQPYTGYNTYINILLIILIAAIVVFLLWPRYLINILQHISGKEFTIIPLPFSLICTIVAMYIIQWIFSGLCLFLLSKSIIAVNISQFLPLTAFFAVSWIIGFIVVFVPSGIGVREMIFIILISSIVGAPFAVLLALLSRLVSIISELINFIMSLMISDRTHKITPQKNNTKKSDNPLNLE